MIFLKSAFVIGHSSLQEIYDAEAACLADERYLALYGQSASFMVPNSLDFIHSTKDDLKGLKYRLQIFGGEALL